MQIVQYNLKLDNVLINFMKRDNKMNALQLIFFKISNFGISKINSRRNPQEKKNNIFGRIRNMALKVLNNKDTSIKICHFEVIFFFICNDIF